MLNRMSRVVYTEKREDPGIGHEVATQDNFETQDRVDIEDKIVTILDRPDSGMLFLADKLGRKCEQGTGSDIVEDSSACNSLAAGKLTARLAASTDPVSVGSSSLGTAEFALCENDAIDEIHPGPPPGSNKTAGIAGEYSV